ncbi:MAG: transglutaminase domain-containing protein [Planctomycetota bacterium]
MRRALVLFLFLVLPVRAQEETWAEVYMGKGKAGYAHETIEKTADGWRTHQEMKVTMNRMGNPLVIESDVDQVETADLKPVRMKTKTLMGPQPTEYDGTIEGGTLKLIVTTAGQPKESEMPWDAAALFPQGVKALMKEKGFAPGTTYSYKMFSTDTGGFIDMSVEVVGPETVEVLGEKHEATRMKSTLVQFGMVQDDWVDASGSPLKSYVKMLDMTTVRSTKEAALGAPSGEQTDVMQHVSPRVKGLVAHPRRVTEALYAITLEVGDVSKIAFSNQAVEKQDGKTSWLRVKNGAATTVVNRPVPASPELEQFLLSNSYLQSADPEMVKAANEAVGGEENAWTAAKKLERWVHEGITSKNMDVAFATASEVLKSREGDCSEHAVLLAALARAAGIPSKVCTGFLYIGGHFGGHAWTSVWVGQWVDLDATLGGEWTDAMRLKFGESHLNGSGMAEEMGEMYKALAGIKVDVLEVVRDGKTEKLEAQTWWSVEGKTVKHSLGFSFDVPDGWTVLPEDQVPVASVAVLQGKTTDDRIQVIYDDCAAGRPVEVREIPPGQAEVLALDDAAQVLFVARSQDASAALKSLHPRK